MQLLVLDLLPLVLYLNCLNFVHRAVLFFSSSQVVFACLDGGVLTLIVLYKFANEQ